LIKNAHHPVKFVGFYLAYTLPTVVFLLCPIVLFLGRNRYARTPPTGSILATTLRLWRHAARGKWSLNPITTYKNFTAPGFWENAKPSKQVGERPAWMNFDDQWVDEVQRGIKACGVFMWYPIYCSWAILGIFEWLSAKFLIT
jgi:POT family proton-dependent oligopeptide transporter